MSSMNNTLNTTMDNSSISTAMNNTPEAETTTMFVLPEPQVKYVDMEKATVDYINNITICYIQPIISVFGLVGNILSLIILTKLRKKHHSNVMLIGLAICDSIYIVVKNYDLIICIEKRIDTLTARNWAILMTPYITFVPVILSRITGLLTSVLAIDRFIALTWPFWFKTAVTNKRVIVAIALCYVIPVSTHFPQFMRNTIEYRYSARLGYDLPYVTLTKLYVENKRFFDIYKNLVLSIVFYITPLITITVTSVINIHRLRNLSESNLRKESSTKNSARERKATVTLIWISVVYVICNVPSFCFLIARYIIPEFDYHGSLKQASILVSKNSSVFILLNSSINFIIYCFAGEAFREEFLNMIGCRGRSKFQQETTPNASNNTAGNTRSTQQSNGTQEN